LTPAAAAAAALLAVAMTTGDATFLLQPWQVST